MTPTQSFIAAAQDVRDVTDASGRVLTVRRPSTLDRLHLFKAVGPSLSNNDRYLGMAMLAFAVIAIDGVPLPRPASEQQIEAAVERLGSAGLDAIGNSLAPDDLKGLATAAPGN